MAGRIAGEWRTLHVLPSPCQHQPSRPGHRIEFEGGAVADVPRSEPNTGFLGDLDELPFDCLRSGVMDVDGQNDAVHCERSNADRVPCWSVRIGNSGLDDEDS